MSRGDGPVYVTRREFFAALTIVWLYIMLVLSELWRRDEERWTMGVLWAASGLMVLVYTVLNLRLGFRKSSTGQPPVPLSDRVKELARDPNRKVEAIALHREETGADLAEAKAAVEAYINSL
jgi:hypothetical protein